MALTVGTLIAEMGFDDSKFRAGIARTQTGVRSLDTNLRGVSRSASLSVNRLSGAFQSLAVQATGTSPAIARLASVVGTFAIGSAMMTGVLAGLAVLAVAWNRGREQAEGYAKAVETAADRIKQLGRERGFRGTFTMRQDIATARARQATIRDEIAPDFRLLQQFRARPEDMASAIKNLEVKLAPSLREIEALGKGIAAAEEIIRDEAMQYAAEIGGLRARLADLQTNFPTAERIANAGAVVRLARGVDTTRAAPRPFSGATGISPEVAGILGRAGVGAKTAIDPNGITPGGIKLPPMAQMLTSAARKFQVVTDGFGDYVDAFSNGVDDMISDVFSKSGLANIGVDLVSSALGKLIGTAFSDIKTAFAGVDKLARAMERNTQALQATGSFLKRRVEGAGLGDMAAMVARAAEGVLNKIAVGEADPKQAIVFLRAAVFEALGKARGIDLEGEPTEATRALFDEATEIINALGRALGLDFAEFNDDTLRQFAEQLSNAGFGLDDLADVARQTTEALRNVPSGFKIALATFNATQGRAVGADGLGGTNNFLGDIYIDAQNKTIEQALEELRRAQARAQRRGSGSGYTDRGAND